MEERIYLCHFGPIQRCSTCSLSKFELGMAVSGVRRNLSWGGFFLSLIKNAKNTINLGRSGDMLP